MPPGVSISWLERSALLLFFLGGVGLVGCSSLSEVSLVSFLLFVWIRWWRFFVESSSLREINNSLSLASRLDSTSSRMELSLDNARIMAENRLKGELAVQQPPNKPALTSRVLSSKGQGAGARTIDSPACPSEGDDQCEWQASTAGYPRRLDLPFHPKRAHHSQQLVEDPRLVESAAGRSRLRIWCSSWCEAFPRS